MVYKITSIANFLPTIILLCVSFLIFAFVLSYFIKFAKAKISLTEKTLLCVPAFIVTLLLALSFSWNTFVFVMQVKDYVVPYTKGDYQTVTGTLELDMDGDWSKEVNITVDTQQFEYPTFSPLYLGINYPSYVDDGKQVQVKYISSQDYVGVFVNTDDNDNGIIILEIKYLDQDV